VCGALFRVTQPRVIYGYRLVGLCFFGAFESHRDVLMNGFCVRCDFLTFYKWRKN